MKKPNRGDVRRDRAGCSRRFRGNTVVLDQLCRQSSHWSRCLALATVMVTAVCVASAQISIPASGIINTVAGAGSFAGDGGPATSARINNAGGVALDSAGNIYIADTWNGCVRKVTVSTGVITTIAGGVAGGFAGDGGAATSARLQQPQAVALDSSGNVYIADTGNNRIRKVTVSTGVIATIAGNGTVG
jgi:hypothetical protein